MRFHFRSLVACLLLLASVLALVSTPGLAAPQGDGKGPDPDDMKAIVKKLDEEPERVIAFAKAYQDDPYATRALTIGALLTRYTMETQKVTITINTEVIAPLLADDKNEDNTRILFLYTNALLVYALGHGNLVAPADDGALRAGLDGLVAGYRNMLKARPDQRNKFGDQMLEIQAKDGLDAYIKAVRAKAPQAVPSSAPQDKK